ncbi:hypothetical protein [Streptomyces sp. NPDC058394]|uniref:hypothetical protein n=1 Tax=Streptomyces sp. NPDC058394 TaxID=3346477 RepID=UPI0036624F64
MTQVESGLGQATVDQVGAALNEPQTATKDALEVVVVAEAGVGPGGRAAAAPRHQPALPPAASAWQYKPPIPYRCAHIQDKNSSVKISRWDLNVHFMAFVVITVRIVD